MGGPPAPSRLARRRLDEPGGLEAEDVVANRVPVHPRGLDELGDGAVAGAERVEDGEPGRVAEQPVALGGVETASRAHCHGLTLTVLSANSAVAHLSEASAAARKSAAR